MAGFFQNLRVVSERSTLDDMGAPASNAYATKSTETTANVATEDTTVASPTVLTIQPIPQGFGAYLDGILPIDIAKAAGAFSVSMQQIKNISSIPIEKFAQVVSSLETTKGLNVNGSSVPTDTSLASQGLDLIALGNGPYGTYTMSNFLGCMSGLPYLGIDIDGLIKNAQTTTLSNIYKNLYLAVTWDPATATATYTGTGPYSVTVTVNNNGGGYTSAPAVSIPGTSGLTVTAIIGTDSTNGTTYGKVTSITVSGTTPTLPSSVSIDDPSGPDWSGTTRNDLVEGYIDAANAEIVNIKNTKPATAQQLITNWEKTGTLLSIEQRAIATGMSLQVPLVDPVEDREPTLAGYPTTQYSFVDSIPRYAKFTQPHMYSQTLEAISNLNTVGGRSIVAMLREARNQARLQEAGIPLDNNIENKLTNAQEAQLIANGILPNSVPAGDGTFVDTVPASLQTELGVPDPYGYYDPTTNEYFNTNNTYLGNGEAIDTGQAIEPGSFAGSRYRSLIPPELSSVYASDVLLPSTYSIQEAIDEVIRCNCDCWDNI
jgi:hypothetical protein